MRAFEITGNKDLMGKLLLKQDFDGFCLEEMELVMSHTYRIEGRIRREFYEGEEQTMTSEPFVRWGDEKELVTGLIKGKKTPLRFNVVLRTGPEETRKLMLHAGLKEAEQEAIEGFVCTIRFEKGAITLVSGTTYRTFTLSKDAEKAWDAEMERFLRKADIAFSE